MNRATEQRIIEQAARGDKAAAGQLIKAHQGSLYAYLLRLCGRPEFAEDICQDAFVRVLSNLDRFDPRYRFSTWLFTIAKRLYMNANQKLKPMYDSEIVGSRRGDSVQPDFKPIQDETREGVHDALQVALASLSEDQREIVLLFHQQNWPIHMIAEHKDMPEGTIKSHLHRARQKMRRVLEEQEHTRRATAEAFG
ncbi:MAG: RNA polymerase sigma factor [Planctomycetota bacterium]|jgi:RNA polymerase sigma-70 factor (ECF subfamily)